MKLPTLYKMSTGGKIVQWDIEVVEKGEGSPYYAVTFGFTDGAKQTKRGSTSKGKNIGRANETTPLEQCRREAQAKWTKQRDRQGYSPEIPTSKPFLPMLAKVYTNFKHKVKFPCSVAPKLDGMRSMFWDGELYSRKGDLIKTMDHIKRELSSVPKELVLDGELFVKNWEFQRIVGAIKRKEPNGDSPLIEYWVYDCVLRDNEEAPYSERYNTLKSLFAKQPFLNIKLLEEQIVGSHDLILGAMDTYIGDGFEGAIVRNLEGKYKINGRSFDLLKVKTFMDMEFKIVGAKEGSNSFEGMCIFQCECNGSTFDVMPRGSEEERRQYWEFWKNGTIKRGDLLTVEFFEWTTSNPPKPRFPVGKAIRRD